MNNLIVSVDAVVSAFQDHIDSRYEREIKKRLNGRDLEDLIGSVNHVANTCEAHSKKNKQKRQADLKKLTESLCKVSALILKKVYQIHRIPKIDQSTSILSLIKKQYNENLHSDFIAALLDPQVTGEFANRLFIRLAGYHHGLRQEIDTKWQKSYREIRLDAITSDIKDPEIAARRIDVLVETPNHVLVFENKVFTCESKNQTRVYYRWITSGYASKEIIPFFLSPSGMPAESSKFFSINYFDLYQMLVEFDQICNSSEDGVQLLKFYKQELENTILLSQINAIRYSLDYLKEKGYDNS